MHPAAVRGCGPAAVRSGRRGPLQQLVKSAGEVGQALLFLLAGNLVGGTITRPLGSNTHREVRLEAIWHRNADALAVRALVDQLLRRPNSRPPVEGLTGHRSYLGTRP